MKALETKALEIAGGADKLNAAFRALDPKILELLVAIENPLAPRFFPASPDPIRAAITDGRREVIALLYKYGSNSPIIQTNDNKTP